MTKRPMCIFHFRYYRVKVSLKYVKEWVLDKNGELDDILEGRVGFIV